MITMRPTLLALLLTSGCSVYPAPEPVDYTRATSIYVPPTDLDVCLDSSLGPYLTGDAVDALADWAHDTSATYTIHVGSPCPTIPDVGSVTILLSSTPSPEDLPGDVVLGTTRMADAYQGATVTIWPYTATLDDIHIRGVMRHEYGHVLGLYHDFTDPSTLMAPRQSDIWSSLTIQPCDVAAYTSIHGE